MKSLKKRHTQKLSFAGRTKDANNYTITGGQFRLTYFIETSRTYTPCLEYTISATDLDTNIETLTGISGVQVTVSGSLDTNDREFTVVFPAVSTPFAIAIDRESSYPESSIGAHPGRDNTFECKPANTLAGEFDSIFVENDLASDDNLPMVRSVGSHNLNNGDIVKLSFKEGRSNNIALHDYMFMVGIVNSTYFTISSNFSQTQSGQFGTRQSLGPLNSALASQPGNWLRMFQPTQILSISSGRDGSSNDNFEEQIVTTKSAHGYESGDIIQLSLHYQVATLTRFLQIHKWVLGSQGPFIMG